MKTIVTPLSGLQLASRPSLVARLPDFISLMKPRVMMLAVFTALVGLTSAPRELDPVHAFVAVLAIAAGAGAAGVLNMWYDADIDAIMTRTAMRPIPRGRISQLEALVLGLTLATGAVLLLALATNLTAAALLGGTIFFYTVVYTAWLKRTTRQNIVIGGAAGALPPVIGWTAATGDVGLEPLVLFLIIFLWTPPHFWALALRRLVFTEHGHCTTYSRSINALAALPLTPSRVGSKIIMTSRSPPTFPGILPPCPRAGLEPFDIARIISSGASAHCWFRVYEFGSRG